MESAWTVNEPLDCTALGSFREVAMKGMGDATFVRASAGIEGSLQSFSFGPLEDVPGHRRRQRPPRERPPPTTTACTDQRGQATVMMDNPALGAFIAFEDASGLPFGKDVYFVTASRLDATGKVTALCLANAAMNDRFLMQRR